MTTHRPWQDILLGPAAADVLLGHADQLSATVVSPTMDEAIVDAALTNLIGPESAWDATLPDGVFPSERVRPSKPGMHAYVAEMATQFLQEQVAKYGTRLRRTIEQSQAAEVAAAVRGIGPRYEREEVAS